MVGYPNIDKIVYDVFDKVMGQVEGGSLVVQKGREGKPRGSDSRNQKRDYNVCEGLDEALTGLPGVGLGRIQLHRVPGAGDRTRGQALDQLDKSLGASERESAEDFQAFVDQPLMPKVKEAGISGEPPGPGQPAARAVRARLRAHRLSRPEKLTWAPDYRPLPADRTHLVEAVAEVVHHPVRIGHCCRVHVDPDVGLVGAAEEGQVGRRTGVGPEGVHAVHA